MWVTPPITPPFAGWETYRPIVDLVNWVSNSIDNGTFKEDFDKHLDLDYMIAYYLQMHVFTQVDNCGKVYASV